MVLKTNVAHRETIQFLSSKFEMSLVAQYPPLALECIIYSNQLQSVLKNLIGWRITLGMKAGFLPPIRGYLAVCNKAKSPVPFEIRKDAL